MGARPWLAHTANDYARMLSARNGPGDRERAQTLLDTARQTYHELGMESCAALSRGACGQVRPNGLKIRRSSGASMDSAPGWIRTNDLPLRRRPLYPLSYRGSRIRRFPTLS